MTHNRPHENKTGRFFATLEDAEKAARAARLKSANPKMTYQEIADTVGYSHRGNAYRAIERCREAVIHEAGAELVASEAAQLDDLFAAALEVLERDHVTVSHGKIITMEDPETGEEKPLLDDGPKLAAIDRLLRVRESYRRLFGIDQPVKVDATVHEVTQQDLELQEMLREAKAAVRSEEAQIRDGGDA
ncbi:hypothetical protein ACFXKY_07945 [Streptomyces canus]|uniref:hypothetical protein n=1 Tax=Streptomyces canus TaxID=58343 RepID=UPI0036750603